MVVSLYTQRQVPEKQLVRQGPGFRGNKCQQGPVVEMCRTYTIVTYMGLHRWTTGPQQKFFFSRITETLVLHSLGNIQLGPTDEYCIHHLDVKASQIS